MSLQQMASRCSIVGIRIRAALMTALYQKCMTVENPSSGDVINMVGNDCTKILEGKNSFEFSPFFRLFIFIFSRFFLTFFLGCTSMHYLWSGPLEALVIIGVLISLVGISALVGLGLLLVIIPVLYYIGAIIAKSRKKSLVYTDKRVQVVNEVLLAIKLVKFYAWEDSFASAVAEIRSQELKVKKIYI